MRKVLSASMFAILLFQSGVCFAQIGDWLAAHPKAAYSLRWQHTTGGSYYDISEKNKIAWPEWSVSAQQDLEDAYADTLAWYNSADPYEYLDETIPYPPVNDCDGADTDAPKTCVDEAYAWDLYLRWIALNLVIEIEGGVPWSIADYDTDTLKLFLDSTSMMTKNNDGTFDMASENPGHGSYIHRFSNLGSSLIAPPRYTLAFLAENDLIGSDRLDTIERVMAWASQHLWHFYGGNEYANMEAHWQYRGLPPITRIIEGTNNEIADDMFGHWTAGCHGTTGFMRNVLRAVNIPMRIATICGHSQAEFVTEGLFLDHGDNVYNSDFTGSGLPAKDLLIDEMTHRMWFGPNAFNHDDDSFCVPDNKIGHQVAVITGQAEDCLDGVDNDGDGSADCADPACEPIGVFTQAKLNASDGAADDHFGASADIDGNLAVLGAYEHDGLGDGSGAAYVFSYVNGQGWLQETKLSPSDGGPDRIFGNAVAIDGDTVVAGSDLPGGFQGAAYVFRRTGTSWSEEAKLLPSGVVSGDRFGISMDIQDDTIAVGTFGDDSNTGAVYLFRRSGGNWTEEAVLTAADGQAGDNFGYDVHISDDAVIVGAYGESAFGESAGAAYVFRYNGDFWVEEAKLVPSDPAVYQHFGWSVGISGDAAIVGAMYDHEAGNTAGAAYVFRFNGAFWVQEAKLIASDAWPAEYFGVGVSIEGNLAVAGAYGEHHMGNIKSRLYSMEDNVGAAYVFEYESGAWTETRKLIADDGIGNDRFGYTVPISGTTVLVGAYGNDDAGELSGAAYVFELGRTEVGQCLEIVPTDPSTGETPVTLHFAEVVDAGETTVLIRSTGDAVPEGYQLGDPPVYLDIETTADYVGEVEICIDYSAQTFDNEDALTLLHFENGGWVNICEANPGTCNLDTAADMICAVVNSLSPFVVVEKVTLFDNVTLPPGHASSDAVFLAEDFSSVGTLALVDIFIPVNQPNPYWLGQVQMTASIPSAGLYGVDMGTVPLTGLSLGQWNTVTFSIPQSIRNTLLNGIAGGFFRIIADTPSNAPSITVNNFRFGGVLTPRSVNAPTRGSLDDMFSFETPAAWTATGATLAANTTYVTDGAKSLKVQRTQGIATVKSADFLTDEAASVGNVLQVDLRTSSAFSWGQIQASLSCPAGTSLYLGQVPLTGLSANTFHTLRMTLSTEAKNMLSTAGKVCNLSLIFNAATGPTFYLDNLDLR